MQNGLALQAGTSHDLLEHLFDCRETLFDPTSAAARRSRLAATGSRSGGSAPTSTTVHRRPSPHKTESGGWSWTVPDGGN